MATYSGVTHAPLPSRRVRKAIPAGTVCVITAGMLKGLTGIYPARADGSGTVSTFSLQSVRGCEARAVADGEKATTPERKGSSCNDPSCHLRQPRIPQSASTHGNSLSHGPGQARGLGYFFGLPPKGKPQKPMDADVAHPCIGTYKSHRVVSVSGGAPLTAGPGEDSSSYGKAWLVPCVRVGGERQS